MAASHQSQLPGSVANAAAAAKLLEKKKEFEAVAALDKASAQLVKRIEELGDDFDTMADAGIGALCWLRIPKQTALCRSQSMGRSSSSGLTCLESSASSVRVYRIPCSPFLIRCDSVTTRATG